MYFNVFVMFLLHTTAILFSQTTGVNTMLKCYRSRDVQTMCSPDFRYCCGCPRLTELCTTTRYRPTAEELHT